MFTFDIRNSENSIVNTRVADSALIAVMSLWEQTFPDYKLSSTGHDPMANTWSFMAGNECEFVATMREIEEECIEVTIEDLKFLESRVRSGVPQNIVRRSISYLEAEHAAISVNQNFGKMATFVRSLLDNRGGEVNLQTNNVMPVPGITYEVSEWFRGKIVRTHWSVSTVGPKRVAAYWKSDTSFSFGLRTEGSLGYYPRAEFDRMIAGTNVVSAWKTPNELTRDFLDAITIREVDTEILLELRDRLSEVLIKREQWSTVR